MQYAACTYHKDKYKANGKGQSNENRLIYQQGSKASLQNTSYTVQCIKPLVELKTASLSQIGCI